MPVPALEFDKVSKRFGPIEANRSVSLVVAKGTIHGIVGENGAGKSTLAGLAYGLDMPDSGRIRIFGDDAPLRSSHDAIRRGVGMVHQHFRLIDRFTVLENIVLGSEGGLLLRPALARARASLETLIGNYGLGLDLAATVGDLPVGLRQRVEILKALYRRAEILILDEPTAVLTPTEADQLFQSLKQLRPEGRTVLLITHKLREIMAVTDRVTVMRQGEVVADLATDATDAETLAELMVGRKLATPPSASTATAGPVMLAARGLRFRDPGGVQRLDGIDLELRAGEITGIAGVAGNGQGELLAALAGLLPAEGDLAWRGTPVPQHDRARALRRLGLAHIPEDRQRMGLIGRFSAWENMILGRQRDPANARHGFLRLAPILVETRRRLGTYDVRPADPALASAFLSGGNQQKLVAARESDPAPPVLLAGQPTRGIDIGAIELIHRRLRDLAAAGTAILLVSAELDEILALADRILVMVNGRITGALDRADADERRIGLLMAGLAAA